MTPRAGTKMTLTKFALIAVTAGATAMALPAVAQADTPQSFVSPSGNIVCGLGVGLDGRSGASCEIRDYNWAPPHCNQGVGNEFSLTEGEPAETRCHTDTNFVPGRPILAYGQTRSSGSITCESEPSGMTCTDSNTGHFFRVSRDSYQLG